LRACIEPVRMAFLCDLHRPATLHLVYERLRSQAEPQKRQKHEQQYRRLALGKIGDEYFSLVVAEKDPEDES
jgi:hypothetical protein